MLNLWRLVCVPCIRRAGCPPHVRWCHNTRDNVPVTIESPAWRWQSPVSSHVSQSCPVITLLLTLTSNTEKKGFSMIIMIVGLTVFRCKKCSCQKNIYLNWYYVTSAAFWRHFNSNKYFPLIPESTLIVGSSSSNNLRMTDRAPSVTSKCKGADGAKWLQFTSVWASEQLVIASSRFYIRG